MSEPQYQFIAAMDDVLTGTQDVVSESISLRLWDLAQDMQKAIEDGEEGLQELRESVDVDYLRFGKFCHGRNARPVGQEFGAVHERKVSKKYYICPCNVTLQIFQDKQAGGRKGGARAGGCGV